MDWNGDGLEDILVGEYNGRIKYYMAVSPDSLTEMDDLMAGGNYIDAGLIGCPMVMDWNGDSLLDLLVGFSSPSGGSSIQLYINSGTPGNPVLDDGVDVFCGGEPLSAYGCTPWVADIDQDGLTDLVFGDTPGNVYICLNTGSAGAPVFSAPEQLQAGSEPMNVELNSAPCVADWNDDGYADIVSGCGENGFIWAFFSPWTTGIGSGDPSEVFSVTPVANPVAGTLSIEVHSAELTDVPFRIYSITGRTVHQSILPVGSNLERFSISMSGIEPGVYLYQASVGTSAATGSFILSEAP